MTNELNGQSLSRVKIRYVFLKMNQLVVALHVHLLWDKKDSVFFVLWVLSSYVQLPFCVLKPLFIVSFFYSFFINDIWALEKGMWGVVGIWQLREEEPVFLKAMAPGRLTRLKLETTHPGVWRQHRLDLMGREDRKLKRVGKGVCGSRRSYGK